MKAASAISYNGTEVICSPITIFMYYMSTYFQSITLLEDVATPKINESNQVMIMVRAAALDPMDFLIASGYGSFIRKFLIKHTLHVSK